MNSIFRTAALLLVAAQVAACAHQSGGLSRNLPPLPSYVRQVETPAPKAGEQLLIVAARERLGRVQANCIISNFSAWYERVRKANAGEITPAQLDREFALACGSPRRNRS